ncbi:MAG TPA: MetQ/NlpA family ABC transporter substrate-binding protein [Pseudogracilibacillus sp.]|nr:MetQ/NlpA family ABC transporter substrate-binding protein [Pseudogracilibacillus sp.]
MKKLLLLLSSLVLATVILTGCSGGEAEESKEEESGLSDESLKVGVTGGPHELIFEVVQDLAKEDGLDLELVVFSDYIMPNTALDEGEIDLNSYQHGPFLDEYNDDHDTNLVAAFPSVLSAIGVYSNDVTDIKEIPEGAQVGIPNDPSNSSRALVLFEEAGVIKLDDDKRDNATILDIVENEKDIEFTELDAAQLPKMLDEVDLAVINGNFATESGLDPTTDSIFTESTDSPYVNVVAVKAGNEDDPVIDQIKEYYYTDEVKDFILEEYKGAYQPSW